MGTPKSEPRSLSSLVLQSRINRGRIFPRKTRKVPPRCYALGLGRVERGYKVNPSAILLLIMDIAEKDSEEKIQQETRGTNNQETKEDTPNREITQTDHLNRRLLDSFLTRLNSSESSEVLPTTNFQQMAIYDNQEFENDQNFTGDQVVEEQNTNETSKGT